MLLIVQIFLFSYNRRVINSHKNFLPKPTFCKVKQKKKKKSSMRRLSWGVFFFLKFPESFGFCAILFFLILPSHDECLVSYFCSYLEKKSKSMLAWSPNFFYSH